MKLLLSTVPKKIHDENRQQIKTTNLQKANSMLLITTFKRVLTGFLLLFVVSTFADTPFTISSNGFEATDVNTGLVWRRCAEGMTASTGGCVGTANIFTHEAALAHARSQTGWRLPNVRELSSIADLSRQNPAVDNVAFPSIPTDFFWSSSPYAGDSQRAWVVGFDQGYVSFNFRLVSYHVLLVRAGQ